MTMFERDFIERVESVIGSKPFSTAHTIADAIINEFIRLNKRVQELEQERRWIPVSERLPEEGQPVLIDFGNNEITVGIWFWENEPEEWSNGTDYVGWQHWNYGSDKFFPSNEPPLHWQPLPQPQKEEVKWTKSNSNNV
jgi:hypothetical protein